MVAAVGGLEANLNTIRRGQQLSCESASAVCMRWQWCRGVIMSRSGRPGECMAAGHALVMWVGEDVVVDGSAADLLLVSGGDADLLHRFYCRAILRCNSPK